MTTPTGPIRVLHVDDSPDLADVVSSFLEREDDRISVRTATTVEDGFAALEAADVDCIVSDYDMPGMNGIEFLEAVREDHPDLPFILYTGKGSEEVASDAISAGVTDYLQKEPGTSHYTVLANRVANAVEQYRSSRALETSRKRLSLFFDESPLGVIEWSEEFEAVRLNEAAQEILGYDEDDLLGESWRAIVPESDTAAVADVTEAVMAGEGGFHSINENVRGDGTRIICEWHNRVVTDDDGDVVTIFSQFQDVTERRRRQKELERHREVIQSATNTVITTDESGVVESVNPAVEKTFGYAPEEVVGEPITMLMGPETGKRHRDAFERYLDTGERTMSWEYVEFEAQHADGSAIPVSLTIGEVDYEGERLFVGIVRDISARRASEAELREKERRYHAVFNDPNILVALLDTEGRVLEVNETALAYTDASLDAITGERLWDTPWFDESEVMRENLAERVRQAAAGEYVDLEADLVRPNGESYAIEGTFRPVTDEDGEVVSVLVSGRDVTERRARERELEWANGVVSTLLDTLPLGVLAEDEDRNVLRANTRFFELFDVSEPPDGAIGADCVALADRVAELFADPEGFIDRIDELIADDVPVQDEAVHLADGRTYARSHRSIELPEGSGHLWTYRDVTEQKTYEARLEALNDLAQNVMTVDSRERIAEIGVEAARDLLGLGSNAVHLADEDRSVLAPAAITDTGRELVGDPPPLEEGDSIAWRAYDQGEAMAVDDVHADPDVHNPDSPIRSELFLPLGDHGILIAGSTRPDEFGQDDVVLGEILAGTLVTALDGIERTEQLRSRERELTRQNERLEEFASIVSHDLRNPLNVADGHLELAREACEGGSEHLDSIAAAHQRMDALIEDVLTLAREGTAATDLEPVALGPMAETCWETVAATDASLHVDADVTIEADRGRLQQVLENLMRNAVEHGSTGSETQSDDAVEHGSPGSETQSDADDGGDGVTVTVGEVAGGFYVEDDGPGIPPEERDRVVEAGYSTSDSGTGFGLSIVKEIADAHGWTLDVVEGSTGGARFEIVGVTVVDP